MLIQLGTNSIRSINVVNDAINGTNNANATIDGIDYAIITNGSSIITNYAPTTIPTTTIITILTLTNVTLAALILAIAVLTSSIILITNAIKPARYEPSSDANHSR